MSWFLKFGLLGVCHFMLFGCVGDVNVPDSSAAVAATKVSVSGIKNSQTLDVSYFDITVSNPAGKYVSYLYAIDSEKTYLPGTFKTPVTVTVTSEGSHILYFKGVNADLSSDSAMTLNFSVATLAKTAGGKYRGDYLVYYANYSSMRTSFATYSGARTQGSVSGTLLIGENQTFGVSGVSIDNQQWPADVELLMTGIPGPDSMRASGEGYYYSLNLKYLGLDKRNSSVSGDLKMYRSDIDKFLVATCNSMRAYNQTGLPEIQSVLTLYSFDNRYFYGHVRMINQTLKKVLTYDVKGDAGALGLSRDNNSFPLALSKPFGYLVKASPAPPTTGTGYLTVVSDATGKYKVSQFSLNLTSYAVYDSIPESFNMLKSFPCN